MNSNFSAQNNPDNEDEKGTAQKAGVVALANQSADVQSALADYDVWRPATPWDSSDESSSESVTSSSAQLNDLLQKLSHVYGVEREAVAGCESANEIPFVDPALEGLDFLGVDFDVLTRGAVHGGWERAFGIGGGVDSFIKEDFDVSLRGSHSAKEGSISRSAFPKDQYSSGMPNREAELHEWFAIPVGNVTLLYDSDILSFRDSGVAVSLAIGMQNVIPSAGLLTASCAAVSLWQDLKVFARGRSGIEKAKYAIGALADTAIIAGGIGSALKNVSPETKIGLVSCGYVGRLLVELIPNLVKYQKSDSPEITAS